MTLNEVWFVLFVLIIAGYLILDGFDMGVGILLLPLARTDVERRTFLNSIGPVWDGNEVWLILGGGVLFAVFPLAYASLFSGMYSAFMLVLLVLILRTVALEFRSKEKSPRWRSTWDTVFGLASLGLALLLGIAFGNVVSGLPVDANGNFSSGLTGLLTPFWVATYVNGPAGESDCAKTRCPAVGQHSVRTMTYFDVLASYKTFGRYATCPFDRDPDGLTARAVPSKCHDSKSVDE